MDNVILQCSDCTARDELVLCSNGLILCQTCYDDSWDNDSKPLPQTTHSCLPGHACSHPGKCGIGCGAPPKRKYSITNIRRNEGGLDA